MRYRETFSSPLGSVILASDGDSLTGLWFEGQRYCPGGLEGERGEGDLPVFRQVRAWLERYFSGKDPGPLPPLRLEGTDFQKEVWTLLRAIPYGQTRTYGDIARELARRRGLPRMSAQAVGGAVGRNPISILVPCHRAVGANGRLTGYAGGVERKAALLKLEGSCPEVYTPDAPADSPCFFQKG